MTLSELPLQHDEIATQESGRSRLTQHSSSQQISCVLGRNLRGTMSIASGLGEIGQAGVAAATVILLDHPKGGVNASNRSERF